jgi:nitroimidazol reductase NimA-like FMN-containing flavoprotein (pyridoxamine 5'-phosphate oxidase superfamily)
VPYSYLEVFGLTDEEFEETSESPQEIKTFLDFKKSIVLGEVADYSNLKKVYSVCFPYGNTKTDFYFFSLTDEQIEFLLENRLKFT